MKSIRRIREMYKAAEIIGIREEKVLTTMGKYRLVRCFGIDRYGRGKGFYYYVGCGHDRKHKREIVAMGDRSFCGCLDLMISIYWEEQERTAGW